MRHALRPSEHGTTHIIQVLLLVLLQVLLSHGRIIYQRAEKRAPVIPRTLVHPTQKDEEENNLFPPHAASSYKRPTLSTTTDPLPHIKALGFFPRSDVIRTPDDIRRLLPQILNESRAKELHDASVWQDFISKAFNQNSTKVDRQRVASASPQRNSSQIGIPHLVRLGFGVTNNGPFVKGKNLNGVVGSSYPDSGSETTDNVMHVHQMIMLGIGSFFGGMLVILVLLFLVFIRRRRKHQQQQQHQRIPYSQAKLEEDDPKLMLLGRDEPSSAMINELSSSSTSSGSGSGDTSSHTSDTSHSTDLWHSPDHIAMCPLDSGPASWNRKLSSISPTGSPSSQRSMFTNSNSSQPESPVPYPDHPPQAFFVSRTEPTSQPSSPLVIARHIQPVPQTASMCIKQDSSLSSIPDLLLQSSTNATTSRHDNTCSTSGMSAKHVSGDGGILSCPGGDVVVIVPPGAVHEDHLFHVKLNTDPSVLHSIKGTSRNFVVSPVVELTCPGAGFFHKPITIKLPYRALAPSERHSCQDDPLCSCSGKTLQLRYWDKSQSTWMPTDWMTSQYGVLSNYSWPECYNPEPAEQDSYHHDNLAQVGYSCFSSTCTIQTNISGTFCLTSQQLDRRVTCNSLLDSYMPHHHGDNVKLCITLGARYHVDYVTAGGDRSKSYVRQINYEVYVCDRTSTGRQRIEEVFRRSGVQRQSAFIPFDLAMGSKVKVVLASVSDTDWQWEIPFDSTYKVIPWAELAYDYGTLSRVEFRCLPKSDEVPISLSLDENIVTNFVVYADSQDTSTGLKISANSGYSVNSGYSLKLTSDVTTRYAGPFTIF